MSTHNYSIVQSFPAKILKCENMALIDLHHDVLEKELDEQKSTRLN